MKQDYTRQDWNRDVRRGYCTVTDGEGREVRLPIVDNACLSGPPKEPLFGTHAQGPHKRDITENSNPLLRWRIERGLKQSDAAVVLGLLGGYSHVSDCERGVREIPPRVLEIIGGAT